MFVLSILKKKNKKAHCIFTYGLPNTDFKYHFFYGPYLLEGKNKAKEHLKFSPGIQPLQDKREWWIDHSIPYSLWISTLNLIFKAFLAKTYISIWHDYLSGELACFDKSFTFSAKKHWWSIRRPESLRHRKLFPWGWLFGFLNMSF